MILMSIIFMWLGIFAYVLFTKQRLKFNREWQEKFKENYTKNVYIGFHLISSLVIILIGLFYLYSYLFSTTQTICITSIEEWTEQGFADTFFIARINNQYQINFNRPHEYKEGDCLNIRVYPILFIDEIER